MNTTATATATAKLEIPCGRVYHSVVVCGVLYHLPQDLQKLANDTGMLSKFGGATCEPKK